MPSQEVLGPHMLDFVSHSAAQTHRLGIRMGRLLRAGDVLLLCGEFGAGKTVFVQGVAEGLGVRGPVVSPSFALVGEYRADEEHGGVPFYHLDLYRVEGPQQALELGWEDYLYGRGICVVEWADRIGEVLPEEHLWIGLSFLSETKRVVRMAPAGERAVALLEEFRRSAFGR